VERPDIALDVSRTDLLLVLHWNAALFAGEGEDIVEPGVLVRTRRLGRRRSGAEHRAESDGSEYAAHSLRVRRERLTERETLAGEFAQRFATDHLNMDDAFWSRLHEAFTDDEVVELGLCVGSWLAFGRLNRVFDVDGVCRIPLKPHG